MPGKQRSTRIPASWGRGGERGVGLPPAARRVLLATPSLPSGRGAGRLGLTSFKKSNCGWRNCWWRRKDLGARVVLQDVTPKLLGEILGIRRLVLSNV